jgi:hypothetical protein
LFFQPPQAVADVISTRSVAPRSHWIHTMYRCVLALAASTVLVVAAQAQQAVRRAFPAQALRGELVVTAAPEVLLNGQPARLSPGARIRGANNLITQSAALTGVTLLVNYTRDGQGQLNEVWLLRVDEAQLPWPTSAQEAAELVFDPAAQTWLKP